MNSDGSGKQPFENVLSDIGTHVGLQIKRTKDTLGHSIRSGKGPLQAPLEEVCKIFSVSQSVAEGDAGNKRVSFTLPKHNYPNNIPTLTASSNLIAKRSGKSWDDLELLWQKGQAGFREVASRLEESPFRAPLAPKSHPGQQVSTALIDAPAANWRKSLWKPGGVAGGGKGGGGGGGSGTGLDLMVIGAPLKDLPVMRQLRQVPSGLQNTFTLRLSQSGRGSRSESDLQKAASDSADSSSHLQHHQPPSHPASSSSLSGLLQGRPPSVEGSPEGPTRNHSGQFSKTLSKVRLAITDLEAAGEEAKLELARRLQVGGGGGGLGGGAGSALTPPPPVPRVPSRVSEHAKSLQKQVKESQKARKKPRLSDPGSPPHPTAILAPENMPEKQQQREEPLSRPPLSKILTDLQNQAKQGGGLGVMVQQHMPESLQDWMKILQVQLGELQHHPGVKSLSRQRSKSHNDLASKGLEGGGGGGELQAYSSDQSMVNLGESSREVAEPLPAKPVGREGPFQAMARKRAEQKDQKEKKEKEKSIRAEGRSFTIVTTAALPWMTGTAVNPLLRAAYLAQNGMRQVTLVVPWLPLVDQKRIHPGGQSFNTPQELEQHIKDWVSHRVGFQPQDNFKLKFYPGRYSSSYGCVIGVGDITKYISDQEMDVAVLEEPEHLNWFHSGNRWTEKFKHVVGIVHTNYLEYAKREENGAAKEIFLKNVNKLMCSIHCDKVVKLSDAVQALPRASTMFVHGVSPRFLEVGDMKAGGLPEPENTEVNEVAALAGVTPTIRSTLGGGKMMRGGATAEMTGGTLQQSQQQRERSRKKNKTTTDQVEDTAAESSSSSRFSKGAYFIGKVLWAKGYSELIDLVEEHTRRQVSASSASSTSLESGKISMDVFGGGEDLPAVQTSAKDKGLQLNFMGPKDHGHEDIHEYKVFVNPSLSDVVATTTAEALAMGKWVVCAKHPSNQFFESFHNCLTYTTRDEFVACLDEAMKSEPRPLSKEERHRLTWEAATERFLDVAEIPEKPLGPATQAVDRVSNILYNNFAGSEYVRKAMGCGNINKNVTGSLADWAQSIDKPLEQG